MSSSSPARRSRSGSTASSRWPRASSASGSPASAGERPGSTGRGACGPIATSARSATTPAGRRSAATRRPASWSHLRRPSRLSTLTLADTQPFEDPAGRFAFSHNGDLHAYRARRLAFQAAGRIKGRADTEVGARWLEDAWRPGAPVGDLLGTLHRTFEGQANLAVLAGDGALYHYAGNAENPVFAFRLGALELASTGIYSLDRSLFRYVAPGARGRQRIELGRTAVLA